MSKSKVDRFDETKNFRVERFPIRGHLLGQNTHALHQTLAKTCLVFRVIFRLLTGLHPDSSNFCIRTRIEMIFISKSTDSTTMHVEHSFIRDCPGGVLDQKALRTPKHDNLSVVLVFDMMPNDYGPNIKVVPLGNVKFLI